MIDVTCPKCSAVYHAEETHIGKQLRCPQCGCSVPIFKAEQPVVQRASSSPRTSGSHVRSRPSARVNLRTWRAYALAILAIVIVLGATAFLLLRRSSEKVVDFSDIDQANSQKQPLASQQNDSTQDSRTSQGGGEESTSKSGFESPDHAVRELPATDQRPTTYNSLPTGTRIAPDFGMDGHGKLTVKNGTNMDAVVRIYDTASYQTIRWFSVQAGGSARMTRIPRGNYVIAYTTGLNWIDPDDAFRWHPSYSEFERILDYDEQRDAKGVQFNDFDVTLHPVVGGNVRAKTISREEFLKGHQHGPLQR